MLKFIAAFLLFSSATLTPQQQARVKHLEEALLAPCCYSQSIAQHSSAVAAQMREEVTAMVAGGLTEEQIIARYKAIYGNQILIVPDGRARKVLFSMPVVIFLLALAAVLLALRKMLRRGAPSSGPPTESGSASNPFHEQIERETGDLA